MQFATSSGAQVTGVCGPSNIEMVKSLGASKVIDYTNDRSIDELEQYDYILDAVGKSKRSHLKAALHGTLGENCLKQEKMRAVTDRIYPIELIVDAHHYVEKKHKKGNVVITI